MNGERSSPSSFLTAGTAVHVHSVRRIRSNRGSNEHDLAEQAERRVRKSVSGKEELDASDAREEAKPTFKSFTPGRR